MTLQVQRFATEEELVECVNTNAIDPSLVQAIICDTSGYYDLFFWMA
jgi:hypothetical protein